ncbi:MAG: MarR family transcriptional regulator [Gammaproteobacteria bacterium]|nr:MarR family transcriptional regulator [Gammaproteobacteria bacterium]MDH5800604.1 MarR family transcriptional regulator [Gammaproteobacteria bacterium]
MPKKVEIKSSSSGLVKKQKAAAARDDVAQCIMKDFRVVVRTTQAHSRWIEKQCGVTGVQLWAMWELFAAPGQKVSDLSKALSIHQSTASNMLDKLEHRKLIRRDRSGPDQRVVQLFLTPKGSELLSQAPRPAQGAVLDALKRMTDGELKHLQLGLDALINQMSVEEEGAGLKPI